MGKRQERSSQSERPSASLGEFRPPSANNRTAQIEQKPRRLDHSTSKVTPAKAVTSLTPDEAKRKAERGELGFAEISEKQFD